MGTGNYSTIRPHSIILASCKLAANLVFDQVCSQVFDKFVRVCDMLSTFFVENLVANLLQLHQSQHVEIDAAGSLVRVRARQMECRKNLFQASQRTC